MKKTTTTLALITVFGFMTSVLTMCKKDPCQTVKCQNGGACSNGSCVCPSGYEGSLCETKANAKFAGTYKGNDCYGDPTVISIGAGSGPFDITLSDGTISPILNGTISGNSMSFPNQIVTDIISGDRLKVSGSGTLSGNAITITLTVYDIDIEESETCTLLLIK